MGCRLIGFRGGAKEVVLPPLLLEPCQHKQKVPWHSPLPIPLLQEQVLSLLCAIQRETPVALSRLSVIIN
jgi:hypothetical protein